MENIPLIKPDLPPFNEIEEPFREILANGKITNFGKYVTMFEEEASQYLEAAVATVSSGTIGLLFSLQALGLKPGQKVILPSFTFMATAQAILYAGGVPVFAEVREDLTISPPDLESLLARHTDIAAVIPIHTYGLPCQVDEIQIIVDEMSHKRSQTVAVLYDAAHAFGSGIDGRPIGTFGDAEVFSLSVTKALVSVEGGMIASQNNDLIHRIRKMRNYGVEANYNAFWPGLNGKMSEFHAVIGLQNLRRLETVLDERRQKARYYREQISANTMFELIPQPDEVRHTFKDFTILTSQPLIGRRSEIMERLKERGIETRAYFYPPVHQQQFFKRFYDRPLPLTETLAERVITLPFYTDITHREIDYVVETLAEIEKNMTKLERSLA